MQDFKYGEITEKIIGASFRVNGTIGNGFPEVIYQRPMALEFNSIHLQSCREFDTTMYYLDQNIETRRVDFLAENKISVDLKAVIKLEDVHIAQSINDPEAYNLEIGLLLNFGSKRLEFHRLTNKKFNPQINQHPQIPIHPKKHSLEK